MYLDTNAYGTVVGIVCGIILRIGGGEFFLGLSSPFGYRGNPPVKTIAMIVTLLATVIVSWIAKWLFMNGYVPERYNILKSNLTRGAKQRKEVNEMAIKGVM